MEITKRWFIFIVMICMLRIGVPIAYAYKQSTHAEISKYAMEQSALNDPSSQVLSSLGLGASVSDSGFLLPSSSAPFGFALQATPEMLVTQGAREEDAGKRSLNHFFDPQQQGIPLTFLGITLGIPSPDWALEDQGTFSDQRFSYQDAKNYLYTALTGTSKEDRERNLGLMFESLGHLIHHIQDTSQPQHVRNDMHCDDTPALFTFLFIPIAFPNGCDTIVVNKVLFRPSAYEEYVWQQGLLPLSGYPIPDYGTFRTPRSAWTNLGRGNAEVTGNNFVSIGTNFGFNISHSPPIVSDSNHPFPRGADATLVDRNINDFDLFGPISDDQPLAGIMSFVQTPVTDNYDASFSAPNPRTSTLSIFYSDLIAIGVKELDRGFTLNSLNYRAAEERLIPRAAAYSIGMLNYFFRGHIEITLPDEGFFSIVDHAVTNQPAVPPSIPQGFTKVKLNLRNATPAPVTPDGRVLTPDAMASGTLLAIAKYTVNSCYQPDLSGDFGRLLDGTNTIVPPANCSFEQYLTSDEFISQSAPIEGTSVPAVAQEFTFDFSSQPIPINARDLRLQIVYRGTLGAEDDAVVVSGRPISEPTYLVVFNDTDFFDLDGTLLTPDEIRAMEANDPSLAQRLRGVNIDPEAMDILSLTVNNSTAGPTSVQADNYVRVAALTDISPATSLSPAPSLNLGVEFKFGSGGIGSSSLPGISPAIIQTELGNTPDSKIIITPFGVFRGIRGNATLLIFKANDGAPLPDPGQLQTLAGKTVTDPGPTPIPLSFQ